VSRPLGQCRGRGRVDRFIGLIDDAVAQLVEQRTLNPALLGSPDARNSLCSNYNARREKFWRALLLQEYVLPMAIGSLGACDHKRPDKPARESKK
jgi:hypothetical protein